MPVKIIILLTLLFIYNKPFLYGQAPVAHITGKVEGEAHPFTIGLKSGLKEYEMPQQAASGHSLCGKHFGTEQLNLLGQLL